METPSERESTTFVNLKWKLVEVQLMKGDWQIFQRLTEKTGLG